jgi:hypothetical protein
MLETALHWKRMISAQTVALKMKMHLYVVQMEMPTGNEINMKLIFYRYQTGQGFEDIKMFI